MDLIYEGITTIPPLSRFKIVFGSEWTWFTKGLRRRLCFDVHSNSSRSEWTWFTKGLRHVLPTVAVVIKVRMDLIYEGITTFFANSTMSSNESEWTWFTKGLRRLPSLLSHTLEPRQNGPDLRRDYDVEKLKGWKKLFGSEWTWFTKGLRHYRFLRIVSFVWSEWTWFTKGLRRSWNFLFFLRNNRQNGPDLRRDYDEKMFLLQQQHLVRMDLIYEGITTTRGNLLASSCLRQNGPDLRRDYDGIFLIIKIEALASEWTWFTKGLRLGNAGIQGGLCLCQNGPDLRRDYDGFISISIKSSISSEWTWFTKGLRPQLICLYLPSFRQNGPDLRRDYDSVIDATGGAYDVSEWTWFTKGLRRNKFCHQLWALVRMDLIYEGITTSVRYLMCQFHCQNGPDLRRDYDPIYFPISFGYLISQNGPDLRRDYDGIGFEES